MGVKRGFAEGVSDRIWLAVWGVSVPMAEGRKRSARTSVTAKRRRGLLGMMWFPSGGSSEGDCSKD